MNNKGDNNMTTTTTMKEAAEYALNHQQEWTNSKACALRVRISGMAGSKPWTDLIRVTGISELGVTGLRTRFRDGDLGPRLYELEGNGLGISHYIMWERVEWVKVMEADSYEGTLKARAEMRDAVTGPGYRSNNNAKAKPRNKK